MKGLVMFVDTHCHLNMMVKKQPDVLLKEEEFLFIEKILNDSKIAGINKIINVGTSVIESKNSIDIAKRFENVFAVVGIHPCDCREDWKREMEKIEVFLDDKAKNKIVGIGETGLDFYHKPFNKQRQLDAFKYHIELAMESDLPVVIHMRDAADETLKVVESYKKDLKGAFHCFSEKKDIARIVTGWGFFIGIDGHVTYKKNEYLREVVKDTNLEKILIETDSPFLPPQEYRGKPNSPVYIPSFARLVSELKDISLDELAEITTRNANLLFRI